MVGRRIARDARCIHQKVLVLGIMLTFGLQALMNLLVVTGLAPTKGIALPLLSWGGTGWLATSACLDWSGPWIATRLPGNARTPNRQPCSPRASEHHARRIDCQ